MIRKLDFRGFLGDLHPLGRGVAHRSPPVYKGNARFIGNPYKTSISLINGWAPVGDTSPQRVQIN